MHLFQKCYLFMLITACTLKQIALQVLIKGFSKIDHCLQSLVVDITCLNYIEQLTINTGWCNKY